MSEQELKQINEGVAAVLNWVSNDSVCPDFAKSWEGFCILSNWLKKNKKGDYALIRSAQDGTWSCAIFAKPSEVPPSGKLIFGTDALCQVAICRALLAYGKLLKRKCD